MRHIALVLVLFFLFQLTACAIKNELPAGDETPSKEQLEQSDTQQTDSENISQEDTLAEDLITNAEDSDAVDENTESQSDKQENTDTQDQPNDQEELNQKGEEPITQPVHSELYIPEVPIEDVITYFNEVCLAAEFVNSGNPNLLQKWIAPIYYTIDGDMTDEDIAILTRFTQWLNTVEGFPGIYETEEAYRANLEIYFCDQQSLIDRMGENFYNMDGAVTFWYSENQIYREIICYRTDIQQQVRNSVIQEEIYNGLGPIQDTDLRKESIIYSGYSEPQMLTQIDELILKLLYHPQMLCGMNAEECESVIRQLYY